MASVSSQSLPQARRRTQSQAIPKPSMTSMAVAAIERPRLFTSAPRVSSLFIARPKNSRVQPSGSTVRNQRRLTASMSTLK